MQNKRVQIGFFSALVLGTVALAFFIFQPYVSALFLAFVLYVVFEPVFHFAMPFVRNKKWLASLATMAIIIVGILLPFIFFGFFLFQDARELYTSISSNGIESNIIHEWASLVQGQIQNFLPVATVDVEAYVNNWLGLIVGNLDTFFSSFVRVIVDVCIVLLALFYLFRDGEVFKKGIFLYSPLVDSDDKKIFDRIKLAINSVVRGSLATALVQGILSGIGFAIFQIPNPFLWGGVTAVMALVPTFGTALVLTPAVLFLFFNYQVGAAIGLGIWAIVAVGLIDNFLGPYVIKRGIKIHPFLILISVLGGISFFGPIGFVAGPVVLSLLLMLLSMYPLLVGNNSEARR